MTKAMSEQEILDNLPEPYRIVYYNVKNDYLLADEKILFGAYCCRNKWEPTSESYQKFDPTSAVTYLPYAIFLSNFRYFRGRIQTIKDKIGPMGISAVYRTTGSNSLFDYGNRPYAQWRWGNPVEPYSAVESVVTEMPLSQLGTIGGRQEYVVTIKEETTNLIEIPLGTELWLAFRKHDGERFYELVQLASRNGGRIDLKPNTNSRKKQKNPSLVDQLAKLDSLYQAGVLTKEEFETVKKRILS